MNSYTIEKPNGLSADINTLYGYVDIPGNNLQEPSINSGPCGALVNGFFHCWNEQFPIALVMQANTDDFWHVEIRLPSGALFDGGLEPNNQ